MNYEIDIAEFTQKIYRLEAFIRELRLLLVKYNLPVRTNTPVTGNLRKVIQDAKNLFMAIDSTIIDVQYTTYMQDIKYISDAIVLYTLSAE